MWTDFIIPIWQVKAWPIGFKSNISLSYTCKYFDVITKLIIKFLISDSCTIKLCIEIEKKKNTHKITRYTLINSFHN